MKVALVHDWLITYRGGEKVLEALCELFPRADLFTLLHASGELPQSLEERRITSTFLQRIPGIHRRYRHFLPAFPAAIRSLDLRGYDLIVSSSHCVAKGVRKPVGARHLSYVHAPMRYMWDRFDDYFGPGRASLPVRAAALALRAPLQRWDRQTASGVDAFVANSHHIAEKIGRFYGRSATVVHPFVELERFSHLAPTGGGKGGHFLWVGALAPYKRVDIALEAFRELKHPLWIVGVGQEADRLRRNVPPNVRVLGRVSDLELVSLYRNARALVFTADEDFGITPLEAQAAGRPVIALGRGGALETVTSSTGIFFPEQTASALVAAVKRFDAWEASFSAEAARAQAARFTRARFLEGIARAVDGLGFPMPTFAPLPGVNAG
jgi:glycosyltransferase involved in cell wall biosynthesis